MPTNVDDIIRKLSPAQRKKVEARAAQLIAEEMTLRELRHARKLTQVRMAKALGINQDSVSRLEKRSDLLLSTLRKTVEAMGGNLSLVAEFPDRAPVVLSGIAEDNPGPKPTGRKHAHVHAQKGRGPLAFFHQGPEHVFQRVKVRVRRAGRLARGADISPCGTVKKPGQATDRMR